MEMPVAWSLPVRDLASWVRERLLTFRIGLLCAVVVAAVLAAGPALPVAAAAAIAAALVLQFRLWDDLADREHDRTRAPRRVLSRAEGIRTFAALLVLSIVAMAGVLAASGAWPAVVAYAALAALFAVLYAVTRPASRLRMVAVLLKYPAFVLLLAAAPASIRALAAAAGLFAIVAVNEWRDARLAGAS